eukprot:g15623.t1
MNLTLQGVHTFYCWALPAETWSRGEFRWDCPGCHIFTPTSVAYKWGDSIHLRSDGSTDVQDSTKKLEADVRQEAAAVRKSAALQYWTRVSGNKDKGALLRLVKLRNPWGHGEWTGLWSDKSLAWRYFPGVTKKVFGGSEKPVVADDGTFFMQWADFVKYFKDVIACGGYMDADSIPDAPDADHWATIQNGNQTTATQRKQKREQGGAGAGGGAAVGGGPATTNSHVRGGGAGAPGEHRSTARTGASATRTTAVEAESEDSSDEDFSDDDDDFDWDAEDSDIDFSEEDFDEDTDADEEADGEFAEDADGSEGVVLGKHGVFAYPERPAAELLPGGSSSSPTKKTFRAPTTLEIFEGGQMDEVGRSPPPNELQQGLTFALYCRFPYTEKMFACQKQQFHLAGIGCQGPCIVHRDITLLAETDSDGNPYCTVRLGSGAGGGSGSSCITFREDWPFWFDDWLWLAVTYGEGENSEDDVEGDRHVRVYVEGSLVMEKHWYHAEGGDGLDFAVSDFPDAITLGATEGDTIEDPENSQSYVGFEAQGVAVWGRCLTEDEICVLEKRVSGKNMKVENVSLAVGAPVVVMGGAGGHGQKGDQGLVVEKHGDGAKAGAARVAPESQSQGATKSKRSALCGCLK